MQLFTEDEGHMMGIDAGRAWANAGANELEATEGFLRQRIKIG